MTAKMHQLKEEIDAENNFYAQLMARKQELENSLEIIRKDLIEHHNKYDALKKSYNDELKRSWK